MSSEKLIYPRNIGYLDLERDFELSILVIVREVHIRE